MINNSIRRVKNIWLFLFLIFSTQLYSQGISNLWLFGNDTASTFPWGAYNLNFQTNPFTIQIQPTRIPVQSTNANIADSLGNLLFYTNGVNIASANGDTMLNGNNLNPSPYTSQFPRGLIINQAALILPLPNNDSIYYLFHSTIDYLAQSTALHLYLTIINIKGNNGLGEVISKNQIILNDTLTAGKITSVKHANGRDWWVICHKAFSSKYYKLLLTPSGISGSYQQNIGNYISFDVGQVCFSPDGNKFAYFSVGTDLELLDFDRCSGNFSNHQHIAINDSGTGRGVAFSPSSQYLYTPSTKYIYQFDVSASNISATQTTIAVWDSFYSPPPGSGLLSLAALYNTAQLAPDGKIYISTGNGTFHMHVIDQPDNAGSSCNFIQHGIQLPYYYFNSLPNHPNYFLGKLTGSICDSITSLTEKKIEDKINIYPNPSNGNFSINYILPENKEGQLSVFDLTGREIHSEKITKWSQVKNISLVDLKEGIYLITISSGNYSFLKKLIIQH